MSERLRPIYSLFEEAVELEEEIDAFVIRLAETVDHLQDSESSGDLDQLSDLALALAGEAARLGYPDLEKVARQVHTGCEDQNKPAIQEALVELTDVARRVRLGHRGAA